MPTFELILRCDLPVLLDLLQCVDFRTGESLRSVTRYLSIGCRFNRRGALSTDAGESNRTVYELDMGSSPKSRFPVRKRIFEAIMSFERSNPMPMRTVVRSYAMLLATPRFGLTKGVSDHETHAESPSSDKPEPGTSVCGPRPQDGIALDNIAPPPPTPMPGGVCQMALRRLAGPPPRPRLASLVAYGVRPKATQTHGAMAMYLVVDSTRGIDGVPGADEGHPTFAEHRVCKSGCCEWTKPPESPLPFASTETRLAEALIAVSGGCPMVKAASKSR